MKREHILNLNQVTKNLLLTLFSKNYKTSEDIVSEPVPSFKTKYLVQIGLRNKEFQCMIILGIPQETSEDMLEEVFAISKDEFERLELIKSALGELSNTIACEIATADDLVGEYGKLHPTPPLVWVTEGKLPDFIHADGSSSHLSKDKLKVYTHLSALKTVGKDSNSQNWSPTQSLSIYDPTVLK